MKFSLVCMLGMLALLLLTLLTESCVKSGRKRDQPECLHGEEADGSCRNNSINLESSHICRGKYDIKTSDTSCVFFTAEYPNGCRVNGLHARNSTNFGCVVLDSVNKHCEIKDFDKADLLCLFPIPRDPAPVAIYLEVQEEGFKPHIVFDQGEKVKEGATLELREQKYKRDAVRDTESDGKTIITVDMKIPWTLTYTKEDGTEMCADGVLDGSNVSKDNAARGKICLHNR